MYELSTTTENELRERVIAQIETDPSRLVLWTGEWNGEIGIGVDDHTKERTFALMFPTNELTEAADSFKRTFLEPIAQYTTERKEVTT